MKVEMDESLEREGYEISNALGHCQNCGHIFVDVVDNGKTHAVCPVCSPPLVEQDQ